MNGNCVASVWCLSFYFIIIIIICSDDAMHLASVWK